jgi:hypothetical protein
MLRARSAAVLMSALLGVVSPAASQQRVIQPDLRQVSDGAQWQVVNRVATVLEEEGQAIARLNEALRSGFARIEGVQFDQGVIEFAVRGKNVPQQSFVGVAFHGVDDETYDAIYFRPFNFMSDDSTRQSHGVQYVSHPTFTWQKLRTEHPGAYEQPVNPAPDPDGWFRARVVVEDGTVAVFVNDAAEPSLTVTRLNDRQGGWVGLWVGSGSGGDFSDLRITRRD